MAIWTLAVNNGAGMAGNLGQIIAMGLDQAAVESISADVHPQINDTGAGWTDNAEPGWWLTARTSLTRYTLATSPPLSALDALKVAIRALDAQLTAWALDVERLSPPHRAWQRDFGHDALASAHECAYLICTDTNITLADRTSWCNTMRAGASDGGSGRIDSAESFYALFTTRGTFPDAHSCWVNPANPTTPLALNALHTVTGTVPTGALDNDNWIDGISA